MTTRNEKPVPRSAFRVPRSAFRVPRAAFRVPRAMRGSGRVSGANGSPAPSTTRSPVRPSTSRWLRLALLVALVAGGALVAWRVGLMRLRDPVALARSLRRMHGGVATAPWFVLAYAAAATLGLPATPFTLAGGALFGVRVGALLNWLGATLGACGAYALGRALGADAAHALLGPRARALDAAVARHGFTGLLRLRLVPLVPFNALNFGSGIAGMRLRDFVAATALGILPALVAYTTLADALLGGAAGARTEALRRAAIGGLLLLAASFLPRLAHRPPTRR